MIYRVYFNRCDDWPQVWSVNEGTSETEITVIGIRAEGCVVFSSYDANATAGQPKAWLNVEAASLRIEGGCAIFRDALSDG